MAPNIGVLIARKEFYPLLNTVEYQGIMNLTPYINAIELKKRFTLKNPLDAALFPFTLKLV